MEKTGASSYLRDVVWRNLVDNLKKKIERKKHTGAGKVELNEVEKFVIGKSTNEKKRIIICIF